MQALAYVTVAVNPGLARSARSAKPAREAAAAWKDTHWPEEAGPHMTGKS